MVEDLGVARRAEQHERRVGEGLRHLHKMTCRPIAQPHPRPRHDLARHLRRLHHPLSTCCLASRWKEDMAFLRSFYVADDIWRFAWSLVGCLLALSWLPPHTHPTQHPPASPVAPTAYP